MFYLLLGGFLVKKFILVMLLFMFSIISFGNENQFMKEIFERKGLNGTKMIKLIIIIWIELMRDFILLRHLKFLIL